MMRFAGNNNRFEMRDVILEIQTELYPKLPSGSRACLFVSGEGQRRLTG